MNFKNTIRVHTMLLGLAGTLLLGNVAKAQQEISQDWISCFVDHLGIIYLQ